MGVIESVQINSFNFFSLTWRYSSTLNVSQRRDLVRENQLFNDTENEFALNGTNLIIKMVKVSNAGISGFVLRVLAI